MKECKRVSRTKEREREGGRERVCVREREMYRKSKKKLKFN